MSERDRSRSRHISATIDTDWGLGIPDEARLTALERSLCRVRAGAAVLAVVVSLLTPVNLAINAGLGSILAASCLLSSWVLARRPGTRTLSVVGMATTALDGLLVGGFLFVNARSAASDMIMLAAVVPLEAAFRWPRWGGAVGGALAGAVAAGWTLYRDGPLGAGSALTFRVGILVLLGVLAGESMRRLDARSRTLRRTLEVSRDLIAVLTLDGRVRNVNPASLPILGYPPEDLIGRPYRQLIPLERQVGPGLPVMKREGLQHRVEVQARRKDGTAVWLEVDVTFVPEEGVAYCVARDITERRRLDDALRQSEARYRAAADRYRSLFERNPDAVFSLDADGRFSSVNPACTALLGWTAEEFLSGRTSLVLASEQDRVEAHLRRALSGQAQEFEMAARHREGEILHLRVTAIPIVVDGQRAGAFGVAKDVTEQRRLQRQLSHQAFHDALTGLPNRALFLDRLGHALTRGGARGGCAVLFLDLDRFKLVNDSLGHHAGDRLLRLVAERLGRALPDGHTISRFGGDEFTVLIEDVSPPASASRYAEAVLDALAAPFALNGQEVFCSASVGIAVSGSPDDDPDELLRRADSAMYRAKERGRGTSVTFDSAMHERAVHRLTLETQLRRAVERAEFILHYQPEVSLSSGEIVGVEALVRWQHPDRGLLPPADFLQEAADAHLLEAIGEQVIDATCAQLREWRQHPATAGITASLNLSAPELVRAELVDHVAEALRRHDIPADALVLEITESVLMEDPAAVLDILRHLKALGVGLAVDDFGTGYSSLAYLQRFPVDVIKIDRAFIAGLGRDEGDQAIVTAVLGLAQALDLVTVAEGVERPDQLRELMALGCDLVQGHLLARPGPASDITALAALGPWPLPAGPPEETDRAASPSAAAVVSPVA